MARKFFYVCAGILLLTISYHFGARSAGAQSAGGAITSISSFGSSGQSLIAVTNGGDVYIDYGASAYGHFVYSGNVFSGGPTSTAPTTWGKVKDTYRR